MITAAGVIGALIGYLVAQQSVAKTRRMMELRLLMCDTQITQLFVMMEMQAKAIDALRKRD